MDQQQPANNAPEAPKNEGAEDVKQAQDLLREYGQPALIGLTIAVVAFLGLYVYRNYKQSAEVKASQMLFSARSAEELQQIATQYSATKAAPLALLSSAAMAYESGQYEPALHAYTQFQQRYPGHELSPSAEMGIAQSQEAMGQLPEALKSYQAFIKAHPEHFLTPMATLGQARSLEQLGQFDEAKAIYEEFIAAHPDSPWVSQAESGLTYLEQSRKAGAAPAAPVAAPSISVTPPVAEPSTPVPAP